VDEQYAAFMRVPGIVGFKEYYGVDISAADLSRDLLQARLHNASATTEN